VAGGKSIDKRTQADLMSDAGTGQPFGDDADHNPEHGGASVEKFNPLELIEMKTLGLLVDEPLVVGRGVGHFSVKEDCGLKRQLMVAQRRFGAKSLGRLSTKLTMPVKRTMTPIKLTRAGV
jgi:hypothetical protein